MADGDVMLYVGGSKDSFRCSCGANVFHKFTQDGKVKYKCNGCPAVYLEQLEQDNDDEETTSVVTA